MDPWNQALLNLDALKKNSTMLHLMSVKVWRLCHSPGDLLWNWKKNTTSETPLPSNLSSRPKWLSRMSIKPWTFKKKIWSQELEVSTGGVKKVSPKCIPLLLKGYQLHPQTIPPRIFLKPQIFCKHSEPKIHLEKSRLSQQSIFGI